MIRHTAPFAARTLGERLLHKLAIGAMVSASVVPLTIMAIPSDPLYRGVEHGEAYLFGAHPALQADHLPISYRNFAARRPG